MRIAGLYEIDPRLLTGDPLAFAKELADADRIQHAECPRHESNMRTRFRN